MKNQKTDLRVIRTKQSIRKVFCDMIMEMDYHDITVKELTQRAMINRNTFYLHYISLDELLDELRDDIADRFISIYGSCENIEDVKEMIRKFYEYVASPQSTLPERIICCDSYRFLAQRINEKIIMHQKETRRSTLAINEAAENVVFSYYRSVMAVLFRQWVTDGKKLTVEELTGLATKLICHGMESVIDR